jgi:hypothetical protein
VKHTVPEGFALTKAPIERERLGAAYVFRVEIAPKATLAVDIEETTPVLKTTDLRSNDGIALIKAYVAETQEAPLKGAIAELLKVHAELSNLEQRIATTREQMGEHRTRMDEIHAQIVTLRAVKSGGGLVQHLEKKLAEVSDKLSQATIDLVALEEKLMMAKIRFQDGVADLSLDKKG